MGHRFDLPGLAPNLAEYLQENLVGRLRTGDVEIDKDNRLRMDVFLDSLKGEKAIYLGRYYSYFDKDNNSFINKLHQEFVSHCSFFGDSVKFSNTRVIYHLTNEGKKKKGRLNIRTDLHQIPFP